jgi:hypothetical protein
MALAAATASEKKMVARSLRSLPRYQATPPGGLAAARRTTKKKRC